MRIVIKINFISLMLLTVGILSSCSSSTLRIESQPEGADVFVNINGQSSRKVGQTPVNILESTLVSDNQPFQISVNKEGFQSESVLVPPTAFARSTVLQMKMKEISSNSKLLNEQTLQKVASQTAQAQLLIKSKDFELAEQSLTILISQYPSVATFYELQGNIHYLRRDLGKALSSYKRAYELNPGNVDTQRMINKIEDIRGDRSPAAGGTR